MPCCRSALSAHADTLDEIKKAGKIRIAIDTAIPPFGMTDDKMQPTGSDVDLAKLLAKDLGVQLEIVTTTGPTPHPDAADQQGRHRRLDAVDHARPRQGDRLLDPLCRPSVGRGRAEDAWQIKSFADLDGKKVAVVRGTTQDTDLTQKAKGAQLVRYEDDATMALAVASGQVDILATARSLLPAISKKNPARTVEPKITMQTNWLAIGVRKDEPKLLGLDQRLGEDQPARTASSPPSTSSIMASTSRPTSFWPRREADGARRRCVSHVL